jgi:hypothetical protein
LKSTARVVLVVGLATSVAGCGEGECYDAVLIGTHSYYVTVTDKRTGKPRQTHTYADSGTMDRLASWKAGDELVVCNAVITNKTRNSSASCGDFGCLYWQ